MTSTSVSSSTLSSPTPSTSPTSTTTLVTTRSPSHGRKKKTGWEYMLAGSLSGVITKSLLQPLDLIKTRLQVQDGQRKNEYKGFVDAFTRIVRQEGVTGLYRGLSPNLIGSGISWGVYFFVYNTAKDQFKLYTHTRPGHQHKISLSAIQYLAAAACAGVATSCVTNPIWMIKVRLQLQGAGYEGSHHYTGIWHALTSIIREEGVLSLWRGLGPALVLVSNGAIQFMAYEELKSLVVRSGLVVDTSHLTAPHFLALGATAKILSTSITYPLAVIRSRLYQRKPIVHDATPVPEPVINASSIPTSTSTSTFTSTPTSKVLNTDTAKYRSAWHVISSVWKYEGWRGFYRGLIPQLIKTAPSSAITFTAYETIIRILKPDDDDIAARRQPD